jgi:ribose transport system ATP-binding protein
LQDFVLKLNHIFKIFPGVKALDDMHLELKRGEIHGLIGENGAGKSTLIKIITGNFQPTKGTIELDGKEVVIKSTIDAKEKGITCVYQELNILDNLSVTDNIFAGNTVRKKNSPFLNYNYMRSKTKEILQEMNQDIDPDMMASELGVGQKQMLEMGKSIIQDAKILVLDEPTSSLGQKEVVQLMSTLKRLRDKGFSILFVSHKLEEIFEICDSVTVMRDGKYIVTEESSNLTKDDLISYMIGRTLKNRFPKKKIDIGSVIFRAIKLGRTGVFRDISFELRKGEILGFSGLVGAGRTELFRAIFAVDSLERGEIIINGKKVVINTPKAAIKNKIAFLTEDRKAEGLVLSESIKKNIAVVNMNHLKKGLFLDRNKINQQAIESVERFNIKTNSIDKAVGELSGGNQQKVVIAKWICSDADIYIFDEPTRGIDVGAKTEVYNIMMQLVSEGKSIIMISSELEEILGVCDRVIVMAIGEVKAEIDRDSASFTQEGIMRAAWNRERKAV